MVREAKIDARVYGVDAQRFYDIVYADAAPLKRYHATANGCNHAVASPWLDGRRTVHFTIALALPSAFQKIVGAGPIPVREVQTVVWDGGCSFTVTSEPELTFPGAANFPTHAQLTVRDAPCGALAAVALSCLVRCSAGVPWVMQKTVEGLMADQAKQSLAGFLDFCEMLCKEHLAAPVPAPRPKLAPLASEPGPAAAAAVVVDATGDALTCNSSTGSGSSRGIGARIKGDKEWVVAPDTPPLAASSGAAEAAAVVAAARVLLSAATPQADAASATLVEPTAHEGGALPACAASGPSSPLAGAAAEGAALPEAVAPSESAAPSEAAAQSQSAVLPKAAAQSESAAPSEAAAQSESVVPSDAAAQSESVAPPDAAAQSESAASSEAAAQSESAALSEAAAQSESAVPSEAAAQSEDSGAESEDEFFDATEGGLRRQQLEQRLLDEPPQQEEELQQLEQQEQQQHHLEEQQQQQEEQQYRQQEVASGSSSRVVAAAAPPAAAPADAVQLIESLVGQIAELGQAQLNSNRLLAEVEARLRSVELDLAKALAYQDGQASVLHLVRRRGGLQYASGGLGAGAAALLVAAAAAGGVAALVLLRRRAG